MQAWRKTLYLYLAFDKYKKGYNQRLIEYGHLVLGTRSAAKFEQVPSSSFYASFHPEILKSASCLELYSTMWSPGAQCNLGETIASLLPCFQKSGYEGIPNPCPSWKSSALSFLVPEFLITVPWSKLRWHHLSLSATASFCWCIALHVLAKHCHLF